jgi:hypothetical protein
MARRNAMKKVAKKMPEGLKGLYREISKWRQTRTRLGPMPEGLWQEAVGLALEHGLSAVAGHLNLGYLALKTRVAANEAETVETGDDAIHFVEVVKKKESFSSNTRPEICEQQIELTDPFGYQLRVKVPSSNPELMTNSIKQIWKMRTCCR